uniref:Uncharacterized protein n=1 Tax=Callorhinchus milii TaxID=7868 RepID=A0A4W3I019_CALMI
MGRLEDAIRRNIECEDCYSYYSDEVRASLSLSCCRRCSLCLVDAGAAKLLEDRSLEICSEDGYARLLLLPSRLEFTVEFLARTSCTVARERGDSPARPEPAAPQGGADAPGRPKQRRAEGGIERPARRGVSERRDAASPELCSRHARHYTWQVQHHSVSACPPQWRYPLSLALRTARGRGETSDQGGLCCEGTSTEQGDPEATVTPLPRALPLNCPALHHHRYAVPYQDPEMFLHPGRVKVLWFQGVVYRVLGDTVSSVEVYPGDGSVLKSHGVSSSYFTHYLLGAADGKERMYMVSNLPPDSPLSTYSLHSILTRAIRYSLS